MLPSGSRIVGTIHIAVRLPMDRRGPQASANNAACVAAHLPAKQPSFGRPHVLDTIKTFVTMPMDSELREI